MKITFLIILILLLYAAFAYAHYRYILNKADRILPDITQSDAALGQGPKIIYVAAGDSTAVGGGASDVSNTYPYKIAKYLAQKNSVEYKNFAVSGATTQDLVDNQLAKIIAAKPTLVTISIGANDTTHFKSISGIVENYKKIITQLTNQTSAKVFITNVPRFDHAYLLSWPQRTYYNLQAKRANTKLAGLETERIKFIDIHSVAVDNSADKFHPSDKGYAYWTEAFLSKIRVDYY